MSFPSQSPQSTGLHPGLGRPTLDLLLLGTADVMGRDPFGVVSGGRRSSHVRSISWGIGLLRRGRLFDLGALSGPALLREVGGDPNGVEEVDNAAETGQEEEVQEDAVDKSARQKWKAEGIAEGAYICGSKMLVSGSTTLTVLL
jgi:hypothetical protein